MPTLAVDLNVAAGSGRGASTTRPVLSFLIPFSDISPDLFSFEIGGVTIALRWYALAYIAGLLLAWRWCAALVGRPDLWAGQKPPMTKAHLEDLLTWVILGVIIGGRLGFVLFYQPGYFLAHPGEILKIWQGGMSFHGGFLGVIVAGLIFCRRNKISAAATGDLFSVTVGIGLLFGRLANFINAELWGKPSTLPWAVAFPGEGGVCPEDWLTLCTRHPSQLYEAALEGLLLLALMLWLVYRRGWLKTPLALTGVFLAVYGASRMFIELFRQADAQFVTPDNPAGYVIRLSAEVGLSMGQILSLPMVLVGLGLIFYARRAR